LQADRDLEFVSRRPKDWLFTWLALSGGACLNAWSTTDRAFRLFVENMLEILTSNLNP
jgi:hypothetical protein